jgi:hypothetical protein
MGRVSSYASHWQRLNSNGWSTYWGATSVTSTTYGYIDVTVPVGTDRLVVVMTWDEPAAGAGAPAAVIDDIDLMIDFGADCSGASYPGGCGEYGSTSTIDNVEYVVLESPTSGTYRVKAAPWAVSAPRPVGIVAVVIEGDTTPDTTLTTLPSDSTPSQYEEFTVTTTVSSPSWITSGSYLELVGVSEGVSFLGMTARREDDVVMNFGLLPALTLGNIHEGDSRSATWHFSASDVGSKTISFGSWSENGGLVFEDATVVVQDYICPGQQTQTLSNQTISDTQLIEACESIETGPDFTVQGPGGNVTLHAGNTVILGAGTSIEFGGALTVNIGLPL